MTAAQVDPFSPEAMRAFGRIDGERDAMERDSSRACDEAEDGPDYCAGYVEGFKAGWGR